MPGELDTNPLAFSLTYHGFIYKSSMSLFKDFSSKKPSWYFEKIQVRIPLAK